MLSIALPWLYAGVLSSCFAFGLVLRLNCTPAAFLALSVPLCMCLAFHPHGGANFCTCLLVFSIALPWLYAGFLSFVFALLKFSFSRPKNENLRRREFRQKILTYRSSAFLCFNSNFKPFPVPWAIVKTSKFYFRTFPVHGRQHRKRLFPGLFPPSFGRAVQFLSKFLEILVFR